MRYFSDDDNRLLIGRGMLNNLRGVSTNNLFLIDVVKSNYSESPTGGDRMDQSGTRLLTNASKS